MKITSRVEAWEQHTGRNGRTVSWWQVKVTTVVLSCGHTKEFRGDSVPGKRTRCPVCESVPVASSPQDLRDLGQRAANQMERLKCPTSWDRLLKE